MGALFVEHKLLILLLFYDFLNTTHTIICYIRLLEKNISNVYSQMRKGDDNNARDVRVNLSRVVWQNKTNLVINVINFGVREFTTTSSFSFFTLIYSHVLIQLPAGRGTVPYTHPLWKRQTAWQLTSCWTEFITDTICASWN